MMQRHSIVAPSKTTHTLSHTSHSTKCKAHEWDDKQKCCILTKHRYTYMQTSMYVYIRKNI